LVLLLPSEYPEVARWPAIRELLRIQVDMQLADLRTMLCLPRPEVPGLDAGCNLTAAALAFNIIAGASVLFWDSSVKGVTDRGNRGARFKNLVRWKYPWSADDDVDGEHGADAMWEYTRSPLTHTLGVGKSAQLFPGHPDGDRSIWLHKSAQGLPADVAETMLSCYEKAEWLPATIRSQYGGYAISVDALAWGVTRMLRDLFGDEDQARPADATARRLLQRPEPGPH
jgi:hypothetical protein